jgi:hypothetical protein
MSDLLVPEDLRVVTLKEKLKQRTPLSVDEIKLLCPSAFTEGLSPEVRSLLGVSDKYVHIPTSQVIEDIMKLNWQPIMAQEVKSRNAKKGFQKHLIKFINYDLISDNAEEHPELLLTNSHDGSNSFKLDVGIFRLICSNGLVIKSKDFGSLRVRHMGYEFKELELTINEMMVRVPGYIDQIEKMKAKELKRTHMLEFAKRAALLRFTNVNEDTISEIIDMEEFVKAVRIEDEGNKLWNVFNCIQEKVIQGKFEYKLGSKERKARPVKGFVQQLKLNQEMWELADTYMETEDALAL